MIMMMNTLGYPVIIIPKVIDISCKGRRNVLLNNYIIDKFVDTMNGFVCIRKRVGIHFLSLSFSFSIYCQTLFRVLSAGVLCRMKAYK